MQPVISLPFTPSDIVGSSYAFDIVKQSSYAILRPSYDRLGLSYFLLDTTMAVHARKFRIEMPWGLGLGLCGKYADRSRLGSSPLSNGKVNNTFEFLTLDLPGLDFGQYLFIYCFFGKQGICGRS